MDPLDLRLAPPRSPRAELAGIVFLPRSIDKMRAKLPGGDLGDYWLKGFTENMLARVGVSPEEFERTVRDAPDDATVAAYFTEHAKPEGIAKWNTFVLNRVSFNGDRAAAIESYPFLADRPDIVLSIDVLAEDDRHAFDDRARAAR